MKRIVSLIAVAVVVCCTVFTACEPKKKADQKAEINSIVLTKAANPSLSADITGKVDVAKKTITFAIPVSLSNRNLIPSFVLSDEDVLSQDGVKLVSGSSTMLVENGKQLVLSDELSALSYTFTIVVLDNDESAVLLSAEFLAADNSKLDENVSVAEISSNMLVRVPAEAFMQKLTLSLSAGEGDVITVNGEALTGGKLEVDTSFPIDIVVSDEIAETSSTYVLKVGKILSYVASHVGTYSKPGATMDYDHTLGINPKDGAPYIMYEAKDEGASKTQFNVIKWNGSAFEVVGNESFSGVAATASTPALGFSQSGDAFALYKGGEVSSCYSVRKLESGKWELLGDGSASGKCATAMVEPIRPIVNSKGNVGFYYSGNTKNTPNYRTATIASYNGEWGEKLLAGVPTYGSGATPSSGTFFGYSTTILNGEQYALMHFNEYGFYIVKINDDFSVTPILEDYKPEGADHAIPGNAKMCTDGTDLYLMETNASASVVELYKYSLNDKSISTIGNTIPLEVTSTGGVKRMTNFAISSDDKTLVVLAEEDVDGSSYISYAICDENCMFEELTRLSDKVVRDNMCIEYAGDNTFYISMVSTEKIDGTSVYAVELFKIALEADIIPE